MPDLLTTEEAATYLRLSERKLYELVAQRRGALHQGHGQVAVSQSGARPLAVGRAGDAGGARARAGRRRSSAAATIRCWNGRCARAARSSRACRKAARPACAGSSRGEVMAAAIHLHRLDGDDETANLDAVARRAGPARRRA